MKVDRNFAIIKIQVLIQMVHYFKFSLQAAWFRLVIGLLIGLCSGHEPSAIHAQELPQLNYSQPHTIISILT
jgi:hypothetical protein